MLRWIIGATVVVVAAAGLLGLRMRWGAVVGVGWWDGFGAV